MTDPLEPTVVMDDAEAEEDRQDGENLLGQLREIHSQIKKGDYKKDMAVPGYNKMIWVRFRPNTVSKTGRRAKVMRQRFEDDDPQLMLDSACDTIIDACEGLFLLAPKFNGDPGKDGENLKPIDDEVPVRFDARLAGIFNIEVPERLGSKARFIVRELFPTEEGIVDMASKLSDWLRDVTKDVNEDFLGE